MTWRPADMVRDLPLTEIPQVIYVPTYNPTVVYGTWWWPAYPPFYWPPPPG